MAAETDPDSTERNRPDLLNQQQRARRRLLQGGAAAAPVLLTVASQPVLAGNGTCKNASVFASINASRPGGAVTCNGKYPAWWCDPLNNSAWPTTKYTKTTLFSSCLTSYAPCNSMNLLQVMQMAATSGNDCVAKHIVAALLNAATLRTNSVLDEAKVKLIWQQFVLNSYKYSPSAGIWWYADHSTPAAPAPLTGGLTEWIKSTMV